MGLDSSRLVWDLPVASGGALTGRAVARKFSVPIEVAVIREGHQRSRVQVDGLTTMIAAKEEKRSVTKTGHHSHGW